MTSEILMHTTLGDKKPVVCAKCGNPNQPEEDTCTDCSASLNVVCGQCGQLNRRIKSRCASCGSRLHRNFWRVRYQIHKLEKLFHDSGWFRRGVFLLGILLLTVFYAIIVKATSS
jgi:predicted amidophosphoribosyltransferase